MKKKQKTYWIIGGIAVALAAIGFVIWWKKRKAAAPAATDDATANTGAGGGGGSAPGPFSNGPATQNTSRYMVTSTAPIAAAPKIKPSGTTGASNKFLPAFSKTVSSFKNYLTGQTNQANQTMHP